MAELKNMLQAKMPVSSRITDTAGAGASGVGALLFPPLQAVNTLGNVAGSLTVLPDSELEKKDPLRQASAAIPGVGSFRVGTMARGMAERVGKGAKKPWYGLNVAIGPSVTNSLMAVAGAALGAQIASDYAAKNGKSPFLAKTLGGAAGAAVGLLPTLIGAGAAGLTPPKTEEKLVAEAKKDNSQLQPYIPGVGEYVYMKHLGAGYKHYRGE